MGGLDFWHLRPAQIARERRFGDGRFVGTQPLEGRPRFMPGGIVIGLTPDLRLSGCEVSLVGYANPIQTRVTTARPKPRNMVDKGHVHGSSKKFQKVPGSPGDSSS